MYCLVKTRTWSTGDFLVTDLFATYLALNWLTELDLMIDAGKAFRSLTTLLVKKPALCTQLVEYCLL